MTQVATKHPTYVLGRSDVEPLCLAQQAALFEPSMRRLLTEAGIKAGMSVLDLGSGTGDVAMLAAEMVGPAGRVLGVDSNPAIVSAAQARVHAAGLSHVAFTAADIRDLQLGQEFDAVVGGVELAMGWRLYQTFIDAGLPPPQLRADTLVNGGSEQMERFAPYVANLLRSLMPKIVEYGIATEEEVAIDTFEERYLEEVLTQRIVVQWWPCIGAWARGPSEPWGHGVEVDHDQ